MSRRFPRVDPTGSGRRTHAPTHRVAPEKERREL